MTRRVGGAGGWRCFHEASLYGHCTRCGMSWNNQARAAAARAALADKRGPDYVAGVDDRDVLALAAAQGIIA